MNERHDSSVCSPQQLEDFVLGALPESEPTRIAEHADSCPACQELLIRFENEHASLVGQLRRGARRNSAAGDMKSGARPGIPDAVKLAQATAPNRSPPGRDWLAWARDQFGGRDGEAARCGDCELHAVIGEGGIGVVFDAYDSRIGQRVALKIMRPEIAADRRMRERFETEAKAMARLRHDNIVTVQTTGRVHELPFLTMEFLAGEPLSRRLARGPALTLSQIVRIARQMAEGLNVAHARGLVHRDVKPENVFLVGDAGSLHVKLLDFGLALDVAHGEQRDQGWLLGTPAFMSPEQARGEPLDAASDLFSFGCLMHRMLTGRLPYDGATHQEMLRARDQQSPVSASMFAPDLPAGLVELTDQLLAHDPARRPKSSADVARRLKRLDRTSRPLRFTRRRLAWVALAGAGALAAGTVWHFRPEVPPEQAAPPLDPAWFLRVTQLQPDQQIAEVVAELRRRNPDWPGKFEYSGSARSVGQFQAFSPASRIFGQFGRCLICQRCTFLAENLAATWPISHR